MAKSYEITYHFLNGEIKKVVYKNLSINKRKILEDMCRGVGINKITLFSDEVIENIVNLNSVCFFEIKEVD
jgi:hypothetical protein